MNYTTYIDNQRMVEWNLSYQEGALIDWLHKLHTWADTIIKKDKIYYFASRNKAIEDNPIITKKPDTIYRYYKSLEEKGIINHIKVDKRDYISLTEKGQQWGKVKQLEKVEQPDKVKTSEIKTTHGQQSENNSDSNPTYYNTILNNKRETNTNSRAIDFLKNKHSIQFEQQFRLKYERNIKDLPKFFEDFDDTIDTEDLEFTPKKLFGRLGKYARNWIQNQEKYATVDTEKMKNVIPIR